MTTATQIQEQISLDQQTAKEEVSTPKKYGVFLLNDHYTPMDFVVDILQNVFRLGRLNIQVQHLNRSETSKVIA